MEPGKLSEGLDIADQLAAVRVERGWSQAEIAKRCGLSRQEFTYFESGKRKPRLNKLMRIAQALDLPLQRFLTGTDRPLSELKDIVIELRNLGLIDLWVANPATPGAFRRCEEIFALAVKGKAPEARVLEGVPAILAWNRWNAHLLRVYSREIGRAAVYRLAWLADIALALERQGGFPGGCPGKESLETYVEVTKKPTTDRWDDVGRSGLTPPNSPLWKRWRISYAGELNLFRQRAEDLVSLASAEGWPIPVRQRGLHAQG